MEHDAVIAERPRRPAFALLAHEAVLRGDDVVRELRLVEEMPEAIAKLGILIVGGLQESVLHAERIPVILAERKAGDLHHPASKVLAVEGLYPVLAIRIVLRKCADGGEEE
jgi:hypothetical protein